MPPYLSIPSALRHEIDPILGSRFVADVAPASDATSALELVERVRAEFPDASHHCWAWRLPPAGIDFRYSDDGEPRGSAGVPILKRIEGAGLVGVCAVVTRWFGGTKLGVGGLMRAYGGAAAAALAEVGSVEVVPTTPCTVVYPYECEGNVQALLAFGRGLEALDTGRWADAQQHFEEATSLDPSFALAASRGSVARRAVQGADVRNRIQARAALSARRRQAVQALRTSPAAVRNRILRRLDPRKRAVLAEVLGQDRIGTAILLELVFRVPGDGR